MAYAAAISLKQTLHGLLNSSLVSSTREIFEFAYDQTTSLQKVLEKFNDGSGSCSERLNALEGQIRDHAHQLEDVLEFHEVTQSYSLEEVRQEITSFAEAVKKMEVEYTEELSKPVVAATSVSSQFDFGVEMVGRSGELDFIRRHLLRKIWPAEICFAAVRGEAGSGRSLAAKAFFEEKRKDEEQSFDCLAWVTVGSNYEIEVVLLRILAQLDNLVGDYEMLDREKICSCLNKTLEARRCLIVLDDVRHVEVIECLRSSCPDQSNGSLVVFTTSSKRVSQLADMVDDFFSPKFLFKEIMRIFLTEDIFHGEAMSSEVMEYGKRILENSSGNLMSTVKVCLFLYKTKKTPEQWSKIASDKENHVFMVGDEISELRKIKGEMQTMDVEKDESIFEVVSFFLDTFDSVCNVKMMVQPKRFFSKMQILSLLGMAGIGKTTCARRAFKDKSIVCHFDHRVWITLGPNYQSEEILVDILAQIYPTIDKMLMKEDEEFTKELCIQLACKRCLIVLDDLWSDEPLMRLKYSFPDIKGATLVTTRLAKVGYFEEDDTCYKMKLLDEEVSWCLLREKMFAKGLCPPDLETAGRQIAKKCEGLPLLILTVADQLLKVEMSVEYWNNVASGKQKTVFMNAHREISEALLPSYERLPQHLKACFLYISVFRNDHDYEIPTSKLTNLWIAERFLELNSHIVVLEYIAATFLYDLVYDSLVLAKRKDYDLNIKTCRLHPVFWHLANSVAVVNDLFYAMNCYDDCSIESMKSQRRLCIRNGVLLGIKDVAKAMESCSKSRSLLCTGPFHQYPVPLYFGSRLLRVLDAVAIRFYQFPVEVVELINLRYLGLTCNGKLPTSISKLLKLQHLIVNRYIKTRSSDNSSLMPVEIWDMKELKHVQVMGGLLPNPKCGDVLPNLSTLLDVSAQSCTKKVLKRIPNLKRLGIQIELAPEEKGNPFCCLNRISRLRKLESLKCVVMNPHIGSNVVAPPAPISMFPSSLKELSLSGFGYPWEYMSTIGQLKNLKVLKLKRFAFRGPKWDMGCNVAFNELECLLVENTDLVKWKDYSSNFKVLKCISIKHCYKLQELPKFLNCYTLEKLEIVDCSPLTVSWAEKLREMVSSNLEVTVHLSWIDESRKK